MLTGTYDPWLVAASLGMAMLASYTALNMAARVSAAKGQVARWWFAGGSAAMGIGIWSMHFLGMLAFRLPIPMGYSPVITVLSLLIAIASSAFALWVVCHCSLTWRRLIVSALLMGSGVCAMHYTGMAAMRMSPPIHYNPWLFLLSVVIAVVASAAVLWIAFRLRDWSSYLRTLRAGASVIMGCAIAGMHYTAMAAAQFPIGSTCAMYASGLDNRWLGLLIIVFAGGVLSVALLTSVLDLRLELRTAALASSLAKANHQLQFLALHDSLTRLPNRVLLEDRLGQEIQSARRQKSCFAVLFLDLDGFKQINDAFGHHTGDLLLVEVAARIRYPRPHRRRRVRSPRLRLRLHRRRQPRRQAHPLHRRARRYRWPRLPRFRQHRHRPLFRRIRPRGDSPQCRRCHVSRQNRWPQRLLLLRHFHERRRSPPAQPARRPASRYGARRSVPPLPAQVRCPRWAHARSRIPSPLEPSHPWLHSSRPVHPARRETGLILPIGEWVLDEACRQMSRWHAAGHREWSIAVNLSAAQFNHAGLVRLVRDCLDRHDLPAAALILEITESTAMRDADASMAILQRLSDMGVHISIDDFGTGYSSLLYLKRLPASELKIDRGFVRDLDHDSDDAAIISAIVALGQSLRLSIVAEGVETPSQRDFLTRLGCSSLQGYLLGRPVPADQFCESTAPASVHTSA